MSDWFVVPIRSLSDGKSRLADTLRPLQRRAFNELLLTRVLDAIAQASGGLSRCIVASADRDALALAERLGATALPDGPEPGLNAAIAAACDAARSRQAVSILILAADLPDVSKEAIARLREGTPRGSAAIVADKLGCGTNGLLLPARCEAKFAFGPASLRRHRAAIAAAGFPVAIWNDPALAFDIDSPADFLRWSLAACTLGDAGHRCR